MQALGVIEMIGQNVSFGQGEAAPVRPLKRDLFDSSVASSKQVKESDVGRIRASIESRLEKSLNRALNAVDFSPNSTTYAHLAQALDACDRHDEASAAAMEGLELASFSPTGGLLDPVSARISLEVLLRARKFAQAAAVGSKLPLDEQTKLLLAATFAENAIFDQAYELLESVTSEDKNAVLAFVLLSEGKNEEAVPLLRAALRNKPTDAESAYNLALAFTRVGADSKALAAALRATRAAPGRQDISLFYLEMLLGEGRPEAALAEVDRIVAGGVELVPQLAVVQARAFLSMGDYSRAERKLNVASDGAKKAGDIGLYAEVASNSVRLRVINERITRETGLKMLVKLHDEHPESTVVVANLAQVSDRRSDAPALKRVFSKVEGSVEPSRGAYIRFQIANLEGDVVNAAIHATAWADGEPLNLHAASAAMVAVGIGMERWEEAVQYAEKAADAANPDPSLVNNAAYIFAMAGQQERAIRLLTAKKLSDPVIQATLGLAYLAAGALDRGMRLYREAAGLAASQGHAFQSLMASYQALVVKQLGLNRSTDLLKLEALSLPLIELPDDWNQRPEFLRLKAIADRNRYAWPLEI